MALHFPPPLVVLIAAACAPVVATATRRFGLSIVVFGAAATYLLLGVLWMCAYELPNTSIRARSVERREILRAGSTSCST